MRKVSIIILTWNGLDYTKKCLDSLKNSVINEQNVDVYVVDNGSERDTIQYLQAIKWITLIQNGENLGFVRGNNVAIDQIKSGDIVLLNNDIIITQMNWLQQLQETAYEDEKNGVVGCRLINENGEFLHAGTYIYPETFWGQQIGGGQKDNRDQRTEQLRDQREQIQIQAIDQGRSQHEYDDARNDLVQPAD